MSPGSQHPPGQIPVETLRCISLVMWRSPGPLVRAVSMSAGPSTRKPARDAASHADGPGHRRGGGATGEPGRARPVAVVPGPGGGTGRFGDGHRRRSGDLPELSRTRGRRRARHRRRLVGSAVGRPHVLRLESPTAPVLSRTPWCWRHRLCTASDTPSASGCRTWPKPWSSTSATARPVKATCRRR